MPGKEIFTTICAIVLSMMLSTSLRAQDVVLTVVVGDRQHQFSLEDLQALPVSTIETTTIWTEGVKRFQGVSLWDFLNALDVGEGQIEATAINDYSVLIPMSDVTPDGPIIAYFSNGARMPRRGKGPLWIVYPYDSDQSYQTESVYSRSIWQLHRLAIK